MRHFGRVHGIAVNLLHQEIHKSYNLLGHIPGGRQGGDIHTKAFPNSNLAGWKVARQNINVLKDDEGYLIGRPGYGYINLATEPQKNKKT